MKDVIGRLVDEIQMLYRSDDIPWIVGYSGGKDSTAVLSLVWRALRGLGPGACHKTVHVISTDTLVENPIVAQWVTHSLETMSAAAADQGLPITAHRLTPDVKETFWVNLIGRGYPAPRNKFRWCTERLKIRPSNRFIRDMVRASGETILVLGTRKAESASRSGRMVKLEAARVRDRLSPNNSLPNSLVFSPIEDWSNDDVWLFLMQFDNPWGYDNKMLLNMYRGASADNECPLVVDTSTPSCGDSRFGCWVCTLVEEDKSMKAMIQNDDEKRWMTPLLELRRELDVVDDRHLRDFRRMDGRVQLFHDGSVPGPYTQQARAEWLEKLLRAQQQVRDTGPAEVRTMELISLEELHEIRRIWLMDKHEIEDLLPGIYERATGAGFPGAKPQLVIQGDMFATLRQICDDGRVTGDGTDYQPNLHYEMIRDLIGIEKKFANATRRTGLMDELEKAIKKSFYESREDALVHARERRRQGQFDLDDLPPGESAEGGDQSEVSMPDPRRTP